MKLLITGGSSYLGQHLTPLAAEAHDVCYTFFQHNPLQLHNGKQVDMRQESAVFHLVRAFQPTVIIHTVGSNRPTDMADVIRQGTQHIVQAAIEVGARLIQLSTDSIFSGLEPPYTEASVPTPVNEYGRSKAHAETLVQQHPNHVIIRTSLIYGFQQMDHGTAWMANALQMGHPVKLFDNQIRHPIWVHTLSLACLELATSTYQGILNVAGQQRISRADFGLKMLDWWGISQRNTLTIGPSGTEWPLDLTLDLSRGTAVLSTPLLGVDAVLSQL